MSMIFLVGSLAGVLAQETDIFGIEILISSEDVHLGEVVKTESFVSASPGEGDTSLKVLDTQGSVLYEYVFFPRAFRTYEPTLDGSEEEIPDKYTYVISLPFNPRAEKVMLSTAAGELIDEVYVGYLTDSCGDTICQAHESYGDCSADCPSGGADNYCDKITDSICDVDCRPEQDSDCFPERSLEHSPSFLSSPFFWSLFGLIVLVALVFFWLKWSARKRFW